MFGLDEPVFHALVGFVIGVVLTLLIILLVDFLYRKAIFTAQARLTARLEAARLMELSKLDEMEAVGKSVTKAKEVRAKLVNPEIIKTEPLHELDLDKPIEGEGGSESVAIYPPDYEEVTEEQPCWYFVKGNLEPFKTLQEALQMFPLEAQKGIENPVWEDQPKYVRDNMRREEV